MKNQKQIEQNRSMLDKIHNILLLIVLIPLILLMLFPLVSGTINYFFDKPAPEEWLQMEREYQGYIEKGIEATYADDVSTLTYEVPDLYDPVSHLQAYLDAKGSPIPADILMQQGHWREILAISQAESSLGTNWYGCDFSHNILGVKPFGWEQEECNQWLRKYNSWEESLSDANRILRDFYFAEGKNTLPLICKKWVGKCTSTWLYNTGVVWNEIQAIKQ